MLVQYPRRQQASPFATCYNQDHGLPSPPTSACIPPLISPKLEYRNFAHLDHHNSCAPESYDSAYSLSSPDYYMPTTPSYNPPIRVQHSTPSPGAQQAYQATGGDSYLHRSSPWVDLDSLTHLSPQAAATQHTFYGFHSDRERLTHKRHSSASSIGSAGPASPYTPTAIFPQILDSDQGSYPSPGYDSYDSPSSATTSYPKALPTAPTRTFTESFVPQDFTDYYPSIDNAHQTHLIAMRQALMAQQGSEMGEPSSVPRSSYNEGFEDSFKVPVDARSSMPKLDRTMSDVYQDELYNPNISSTPSQQPQQKTSHRKLLSPLRDVFSERLQAASDSHLSARSASPQTTASRERSPFRPDSASYTQQPQVDETRTISPKEADLNYIEPVEDSTPLFPQETTAMPAITQSLQYPGMKSLARQESTQSDAGESGTQQSFNSMATTRRESSSNYSSASAFPSTGPKFSNASPGGNQIPQQYPFISQSRRQNSSMRSGSDQSPEFHATLNSMESTKSDNGQKSSQEQSDSPAEAQRPARTTADSGTYTCTYHGCSQRFETPAKLQRHKREGHRMASPHNGPNSPGGSSGSIAALLAARNSQAGPHKCDRINPTTGKPCNSVFSRPYDLTRHEDTIHNARKQKVRCQLCTEEKTFSRNDALTRHMRVVHPEVDFPGKNKRK